MTGGLAVVGNTLYLQISGTTQPLSWTGGDGAWDVNNIANTIWKDSTAASTYFVDSDSVVFDNTAGSGGTVTLNSIVAPGSVTVNNPAADYTISGSGAISGTTALTKSGAGKLTLATANTYTGATAVNNGTLELSGSSILPASSPITINGGTLNMGSASAVNNTGNNTSMSTTTTSTMYQGSGDGGVRLGRPSGCPSDGIDDEVAYV